jgi:uncharacterized protein DUF3147
MRISIRPTAIRETKWYEYLVRFAFGGLITAIAGLIASKFGPVVGGLFLAFPAILPASATLIETHQRKRKQELGLNGRKRGRDAASIDAAGAVIGSVGLMAFGAVVWLSSPSLPAWLMLTVATLAWFGCSYLLWFIRRRV